MDTLVAVIRIIFGSFGIVVFSFVILASFLEEVVPEYYYIRRELQDYRDTGRLKKLYIELKKSSIPAMMLLIAFFGALDFIALKILIIGINAWLAQ